MSELSRVKSGLVHWLAGGALAASFCLVISYFSIVDFYNTNYQSTGAGLVCYHFCRLLLCAGALALVYTFGTLVLMGAVAWPALSSCHSVEKLPVLFLVGGAAWQLLLFILGLLGLFTYPVMLSVCVVSLILAGGYLALWSQCAAATIRFFWQDSQSHFVRFALCSVVVAFILTKGLLPFGMFDLYVHYLPYYIRVTETGSLGPNEIWYQFFYSKGSGLFILAILFSDPLGHQIITSLFLIHSALLVAGLIARYANAPSWPTVGFVTFLAVLLYCPGFRNLGFWCNPGKSHEPNAAFLLMSFWASLRCFDADAGKSARALCFLSLVLPSLAVIASSVPISVFLVTAMVVQGAVHKLSKNPIGARLHVIGSIICLAGLCAILLLNYHCTGLFNDNPAQLFFAYADISKILERGTLLEVIWATNTHRSESPDGAGWWKVTLLLVGCFRLDLLWPWAIPTLLYGVMRRTAGRMPVGVRNSVFAQGAAFLVFAIAVGARQPVSFYRASVFVFGPMLACLIIQSSFLKGSRTRFGKALPTLLLAIQLFYLVPYCGQKNLMWHAQWAGAFLTGRVSIAATWEAQGVYSGYAEVFAQLPPKERVWTFQPTLFCMVPKRRVESFFVYPLSRHWETVMFDTPEKARDVLQCEGLNHFFFSAREPNRCLLAVSPLFQPANIQKHLAIKWTNGVEYLLTWPGADTRPIDDHFMRAYEAAVFSGYYDFYLAEMQRIRALSKELEERLPRPETKSSVH